MRQYVWLGLAGALSVAAYAPLEFWWLMPFCLAVVYFFWSKETTPFQAFKQGFVYAICQFGIGVSWVYVSLHTFGNMPPIMAGAAVLLFTLTLSLFYSVVGYIFVVVSAQYDDSRYLIRALLFASLWVLADWSRTFVLTGFPWLDVGYSQTTRLLSHYAPVGGVYLVSFILLLIAALITQVVIYHSLIKKAALPFVIICVLLLGGTILKTVQWTTVAGDDVKVALVQANIPIEKKWQPSFRDTLLQRYVDLLPKIPVDLVVFSETALPMYLHNMSPELWKTFSANADSLVAGITEVDRLNERLYNSAVMTCGAEQKIYRKQHLVPFGEYLPLRPLLSWILDYLQLPMSDFSSWTKPQTMNCGDLKIALSICYEDAFSEEIRSNLGDGQIMVNISEDAWFGNSLAPHQRRQMAQMRAQELSRPMVRSSNSGPSNLIDANGVMIAASQQFSQQTLIGKVSPRIGSTPFLNYGIWVIYASGLWVLGAIIVRLRFKVKPVIFF